MKKEVKVCDCCGRQLKDDEYFAGEVFGDEWCLDDYVLPFLRLKSTTDSINNIEYQDICNDCSRIFVKAILNEINKIKENK